MTTATEVPSGVDLVPGVASGRWVTASLHEQMFAHRLPTPLALGPRWTRTALCGLTTRSWQDTASCPTGPDAFARCQPCERDLIRRADAELRGEMGEPVAVREFAPPPPRWRPAGFSPTPATTGAAAR